MIFTRHQFAHIDDYTWDVEATGLLDETAIDYNASPYRLKPSYAAHCVVFQNHFTGEYIGFHDGPKYVFDGRTHEETVDGNTYVLANYIPLDYTHYPMSELKGFISRTKFRRVVAHNMISYDLLAAKLLFGVDYTLGNEWREGGLTTWSSDTWAGNKIGGFWDTLPLSKCLNPDRYGGHSLEKLASGGVTEKIQFRKHMHPDVRFLHFAADMLYYCIFDVGSNTEVYFGLMDGTKNKEGPNKPGPNLFEREELMKWMSAIRLEHNIADIITRQEHRGFDFNMPKAQAALDELDQLMHDRRIKVEPVLPKRPATQAFMKDFTPPKIQLKQNLELSSHMTKFIEKHGGSYNPETMEATLFNEVHKLPMPCEPLVTTMDATIDDTTHIKNWLVGLGWNPSEYKEKDITVDTKKNKLTQEKLEIAIDRYLDQTYAMAFKEDRLAHFGWSKGMHQHTVRAKLLERAGRSLKVLTNPSFTKGQDKDMCPDLERISEQFPFAKDVVEYLTYKHRRNSILGGGIDWDDPDEEPEKGYIASVREDGRIATPADTCGAATSRFKHRKVANIPRVTSLYGYQLRDLFGVGTGYYQIGYDFDSLEARIESAYCWQYDEADHGYCLSLMMDKPNDVHTKMAQAISAIIGRPFGRSPAKNVKYGCTYGAQAAKVAKTIGDTLQVGQQVFDAFWLAAFPLDSLKKALTAQWEANGKKYIIGIDGRRVPTRSAHAILNSLFQSGGVICAKRAMVIHDVKLKQAGLSVDFFKDDWKNKEFCQQMIAYHDEAQLEATAQSFKFKAFSYDSIGFTAHDDEDALKAADKQLKEAAQKFKDEQFETVGEVWSDISHNDRGFYVAYCKAGQLAVQSVTEAGLFYRADDADTSPVAAHALDLTAGYIVNRSWAGCH
jgi:hypothetical protein